MLFSCEFLDNREPLCGLTTYGRCGEVRPSARGNERFYCIVPSISLGGLEGKPYGSHLNPDIAMRRIRYTPTNPNNKTGASNGNTNNAETSPVPIALAMFSPSEQGAD